MNYVPDMGELLGEKTSNSADNKGSGELTSKSHVATSQSYSPVHQILEVNSRDSMESLMDQSTDEPEKCETLHVSVAAKEDNVIHVEWDQSCRGIIRREQAGEKEWGLIQVGDEVVADLKLPVLKNEIPELVLRRVVQHKRSSTSMKHGSRHASVRVPAHFIVDGSNVCRGYSGIPGRSSLAPLLTLVAELRKLKSTCQCIFDANERYVLGKNRDESGSDQVYESLLREFHGIFREVASASNADDTILALADRNDLAIISNDRFNKSADRHTDQYPWLMIGEKRLIQWNVEDGRLNVPKLNLSVPMRLDLLAMIAELRAYQRVVN